MLLASTGIYGTCVAFHEKKDGVYQQISYGKLRRDVEALGVALDGCLPMGARVLIVGKNSYRFVLAYLALICGVGVPIPANAAISAEELATLARESGVSAVLYAEEVGDKVATLEGLVKISFDTFGELIAVGKALFAHAFGQPDPTEGGK